jgi:putative sigma-54 modulation protein
VYLIERQIRKNKTRLERRLRSGAFDSGIIETGEDFEEEAEFNIRRKSFSIKPMSVEEAIMQMNLLGHEFFVFRDSQSEEICVVYKRHGNTYGLIEDKPE